MENGDVERRRSRRGGNRGALVGIRVYIPELGGRGSQTGKVHNQ